MSQVELSACCGALLDVTGDPTRYWVCRACKQPCDPLSSLSPAPAASTDTSGEHDLTAGMWAAAGQSAPGARTLLPPVSTPEVPAIRPSSSAPEPPRSGDHEHRHQASEAVAGLRPRTGEH